MILVKKSIINYINKINIFSLIFEENIHEAFVLKTYILLSFLYKNKSFSKEQIKHLWMLSQDKYQTISYSIIELERNENLYKILYQFSDELTLNECLNKKIIIKSRTILVKLLFNQIYIKDLINIIKKCIINIGKNLFN